jgi:hypothetical protein
MEALKNAAVAGERKAVTSERYRSREKQKAAASQEALILELEETALGEPNGESHGALDCGVQSRACRRWTVLGIGSLGTVSFFRGVIT